MTPSYPFKKYLLAGGVALTALGLLHAQSALPTPWKISTGANYLRGDFGLDQDTEVFTAPVTVTYESVKWRLKGSVPFIWISGPAQVFTDGGGGAGAPTRPSAVAESGMGDLNLTLTRKLGNVTPNTRVDLSARVKLPTADEDRGLGSGTTDVYVQGEVYHTVGRLTPFATLGYRFMGENDAYRLEDGVYASGGIAARATDRTTVGGVVTWGQSITSGGDDSTELIGFVSHKVTDQWDAQGFALKGFSDASPEFGVGGQLSYRF